VRIYGRNGRIGLANSNWLRYEISVFSTTMPAYAEPTTIRPALWGEPVTMMMVAEVEEFGAAIKENRPPAVTASDGRKVLKVLDAVTESARSRGPARIG
jgi:predicted dehydrogenase